MTKLNPALFISATPIAQTVTLPDGSTEVLHFRQLTKQEIEKYHEERNSADVDLRTVAEQRLIARSLCDEAGKQVMDFDQARQLTVAGVAALLPAVLEVNRAPGKANTPAEGTTGSDAS